MYNNNNLRVWLQITTASLLLYVTIPKINLNCTLRNNEQQLPNICTVDLRIDNYSDLLELMIFYVIPFIYLTI